MWWTVVFLLCTWIGFIQPDHPTDWVTTATATVTTDLPDDIDDAQGTILDYVGVTCPAGHRCVPVLECLPCDYGSYKQDQSSNLCSQCPAGCTTLRKGATSWRECIAKCPHGYEETDDGKTCKKCSPGFYKESWDNVNCSRCPNDDYDDSVVGLTSVNDCFSSWSPSSSTKTSTHSSTTGVHTSTTSPDTLSTASTVASTNMSLTQSSSTRENTSTISPDTSSSSSTTDSTTRYSTQSSSTRESTSTTSPDTSSSSSTAASTTQSSSTGESTSTTSSGTPSQYITTTSTTQTSTTQSSSTGEDTPTMSAETSSQSSTSTQSSSSTTTENPFDATTNISGWVKFTLNDNTYQNFTEWSALTIADENDYRFTIAFTWMFSLFADNSIAEVTLQSFAFSQIGNSEISATFVAQFNMHSSTIPKYLTQQCQSDINSGTYGWYSQVSAAVTVNSTDVYYGYHYEYTNELDSNGCPLAACSGVQYYAATECSSDYFCQCEYTDWLLRPCAPGTFFDNSVGVCNHADATTCRENIG